MAYSGKTRFYGLPFMMDGDYVTESEERRSAAIIDNLLYVATYGASKAVIEDAFYKLTNAGSDPCKLTLSAYGAEYIFMAIVNFRLAYRLKPIELTLEKGAVHYVYVVAAEGMDTDPTLCRIVTSTTLLNDTNHLLLATVDYTGEEAILDTDANKQYLTNLAAHSMDYTNPHGTNLVQDTLKVAGKLFIGNAEMMPCILHKIEASPGSTPTIIQIPDLAPKFVTAMPGDLDIGTVACVINADDTISISNSGSAGKPITLKIEGIYK